MKQSRNAYALVGIAASNFPSSTVSYLRYWN